MVAEVLSHPFRFGLDGRAVTVDQASDLGVAEQINAYIQTELGERPLSLAYGSPDPTFDNDFNLDALTAGLYEYCPEAVIDEQDAEFISDNLLEIRLGFRNVQS